jgi:hypothetical protein
VGSRRRLRLKAGAFCAALALASAPAVAATITAQASASVVKPLILTKVQDFELGSIVPKTGTYSNAIVSLSRTGVFSCSSNLVCTGAVRVAQFNVSGTNNRTLLISAPNVTMVNKSDSTKTLTLVVDSPGSVLLTNSGPPGINFNLGGSLAVSSTTAGGDYVGTFNVTVDYQ